MRYGVFLACRKGSDLGSSRPDRDANETGESVFVSPTIRTRCESSTRNSETSAFLDVN